MSITPSGFSVRIGPFRFYFRLRFRKRGQRHAGSKRSQRRNGGW